MDNLLIRIASTVGARQAENVASAALLYLLQQSERVGDAVAGLIETRASIPPLPRPLRFRGQQSEQNLGITDISAFAGSEEVLIIEAKIAAGLHEAQASTYLKRLRPKGVLVILAPKVRVPSLFRAACEQCESTIGPGEIRAESAGIVLVGLSWEDVIGVIKTVTLDAALASEVDQVEGLYRYIEGEAFMPFSSDDFSVLTARTLTSIDDLANRVFQELKSAVIPGVEFASSNQYGGGLTHFGGRGRVAGYKVWIGRDSRCWLRHAETPFWLEFEGLGDKTDAVAEAIGRVDDEGRQLAVERPTENRVLVALWCPKGDDIDTCASALVPQVSAVAMSLNANA
jgi:hypothetical protein